MMTSLSALLSLASGFACFSEFDLTEGDAQLLAQSLLVFVFVFVLVLFNETDKFDFIT